MSWRVPCRRPARREVLAFGSAGVPSGRSGREERAGLLHGVTGPLDRIGLELMNAMLPAASWPAPQVPI